jgi:beta-lactamase regulating signal transducer with metallopeptidase domain
MSAMKNEILTICYQLVAATVNGTYQGILIAVLVAASLRMSRRTNAATRYAVWLGTLLLLALIIPAHFLRSRLDAGVTPATVETSVAAPVLPHDSDVISTEASSLPPDSDVESDSFAADARFPADNPGSDAECTGEPRCPDSASASGPSSQSSEDPTRAIVPASLEAAPSNQVGQSPTPEPGFLAGIRQKLTWLGGRMVTPVPPWKVAPKTRLLVAALLPMIWLTIAGAKGSFLIWQLFRIRRLKLNSVEPRPEFEALFLSLRESLGVRRNVTLRVSTDSRSAVVLGFFKPVILLPADAGLEACAHVLRHELAHVRRRDDWANLLQQSIKALFPFHPAIWWVSNRISLEREIACDDQVLQSHVRPRAYALLLADLAGRFQAPVLAPGVLNNQSQLKQRIDMILNSNRNTSPRLAKARLGLLGTAAALLAMTAIYAAPRLAFAQSTDAAAPAPPSTPDGSGAAPNVPPTPAFAVAGETDSSVSSSDAPSALPPAPPVPTGPKFKPGSTISTDVQPAITPRPSITIGTPPTPALPPVAAVRAAPPALSTTQPMTLVAPAAPVAPLVAATDSYAQSDQPVAPRAARRSGKDPSLEERLDQLGVPRRPGRDPSLEERLDRLEKMVESLVAQQKKTPNQFEFSPKTPPPGGMNFNWKSSEFGNDWGQKQADFAKKQAEFELKRADMAKLQAEIDKLNTDAKISPKARELAEQQAKMAGDQARIAEQAAREAQRAARDARTIRKPRAASHEELNSLHKQREMLQKQMETLDRQIEKLEKQQKQLDEKLENGEQGQSDSNGGQHTELSNNSNDSKAPGFDYYLGNLLLSPHNQKPNDP